MDIFDFLKSIDHSIKGSNFGLQEIPLAGAVFLVQFTLAEAPQRDEVLCDLVGTSWEQVILVKIKCRFILFFARPLATAMLHIFISTTGKSQRSLSGLKVVLRHKRACY